MAKHSLPFALRNLPTLNVSEDVGVEDRDCSQVRLAGQPGRLLLSILEFEVRLGAKKGRGAAARRDF